LQQNFIENQSSKLCTNTAYHIKTQTLIDLFITMLKVKTHTLAKSLGGWEICCSHDNKETTVKLDIQIQPSPHSEGESLFCRLSGQENYISYLTQR